MGTSHLLIVGGLFAGGVSRKILLCKRGPWGGGEFTT